MPPPKRYWDSSVFLDWIKEVAGHCETCDLILSDAQSTPPKCLIYTSAIALAEVTKERKGPLAVGKELEEKITKFFQNDYMVIVPLDRVIAERARRLIWDFPFLKPRDAIHLATALAARVDVIEAYDSDFARVARQVEEQKIPGFPPIREPEWTGQPDLPGTPAPTA